MQQVSQFLTDECRFVAVVAADVDQDEKVIHELTRRQFNAFRAILSNPRVLIKGTAGSGKTMIALWTPEALAACGSRVLFVCFNRILAAWLKAKCGRQADLVNVHGMHSGWLPAIG